MLAERRVAVCNDCETVSRIRCRLNRNCSVKCMTSMDMDDVVFMRIEPFPVRPILPDVSKLALIRREFLANLMHRHAEFIELRLVSARSRYCAENLRNDAMPIYIADNVQDERLDATLVHYSDNMQYSDQCIS